jgi:hypothetical protein
MTITYHQYQEVIKISTNFLLTCLLTPCPIKDNNRGKASFMHLG